MNYKKIRKSRNKFVLRPTILFLVLKIIIQTMNAKLTSTNLADKQPRLIKIISIYANHKLSIKKGIQRTLQGLFEYFK